MFLLLGFCALLLALACAFIDVNHPFGLATTSRALYVDEGFYSDAAQNFAKFGQWNLPLDSSHWPGAPMLLALQSPVFAIFGVSITAARLISVAFGLISCLAFYAIARTRLSPASALALTAGAVLTFTFVAHARGAIADPVATGYSMLALLVYVRVRQKPVAIVLSLVLGYFAVLSKMYFLFTLLTLFCLWTFELVLWPAFQKKALPIRQVAIFAVTVGLIALSYLALRSAFSDQFADFFHINSNKKPNLNPAELLHRVQYSFLVVPLHSKTHVFLVCAASTIGFFVATRLFPAKLKKLSSDIQALGRAEWALTLFLFSGIFVVANLHLLEKAHYYFFTILPICYLSAVSLALISPKLLTTPAICLLVSVHLAFQSYFYYRWFDRPQSTTINDASRDIANIIHQDIQTGVVPVIGEYSAQLGLFSQRIMSLDERWVSQRELCARIARWHPPYRINVVWPGSSAHYQDSLLANCDGIRETTEVGRYPVFDEWRDELVLSRIHYQDEK